MERYFIVFYDARNSANWSRGNIQVTTAGHYINREYVKAEVSRQAPHFEPNDVCITNVIELTLKEFAEWDS